MPEPQRQASATNMDNGSRVEGSSSSTVENSALSLGSNTAAAHPSLTVKPLNTKICLEAEIQEKTKGGTFPDSSSDGSLPAISADPQSVQPHNRSMENVIESTSSKLNFSDHSQSVSLMGVAASKDWVSFEDRDDVLPDVCQIPIATPASMAKDNSTISSNKSWVQFDTLLQPSDIRAHSMVSQFTGESVHSDTVADDRQSNPTISTTSLTESHVSHEYFPLESSPSPQPSSERGNSDWVKFEASRAENQLVPPLYVPLSSPPTGQSLSSSASPLSSLSSPVRSTPQEKPNQHAIQNGHQPKLQKSSWVSFDEPDVSALTSPTRTKLTPNITTEDDSVEKRALVQKLQQSLAIQQQKQIQSRHPQQGQSVVRSLTNSQVLANSPVHVPSPSAPNLTSQPLVYPLGNQPSNIIPPSTSTPQPGNPFREEMLHFQQNSVSSQFNPFQNVAQTPSTPGGTVSAMWGESPITPGTVTAMWEQFEQKSASVSTAYEAPGNPFAIRSVENVPPQPIFQQTPTYGGPTLQTQSVLSDTASATPLKDLAERFEAQAASQLPTPASTSPSSSLHVESTPPTNQPFQRYTPKSSKQNLIRGSGKRPKEISKDQKDIVSLDETPFVDQFPKEKCDLTSGWSLMLRCPDKKRLTGSRYWKPVRVMLLEGSVIQLFDANSDLSSQAFRELPLQCSYNFGDRKLQAYDMLGKIHTVKLLYVSYTEKRRYNTRVPYEKVMVASQLVKLGSTHYNTFRSFIITINEHLMRLPSFQNCGVSYKQDAVGVIVADSCRSRIASNGEIEKQSTNVEVVVLAFLSDMPECSISLNDVQVKGVQVVSRRDIIPNKTNQWIKLENVELHKCAKKNLFVESRLIQFEPLDGCRFCLMRFKVRPKENKDLPLHVKVTVSGEGAYLELRADLLLPAQPGQRDPSMFTCENIMMRIPIPDTWIKYFRREKHLGFYSIKSSHGKPSHIKQGSMNPKLLETSVGSAKYEHAYKSIVWRIAKLPERATVFTASHILMCRIHLGSHREVPRSPQGDVELEFTMPQTTASRATVRSLSVTSDKPSEKRIRYRAHYEYFVEMENKVILQDLDGDGDPARQCIQQ